MQQKSSPDPMEKIISLIFISCAKGKGSNMVWRISLKVSGKARKNKSIASRKSVTPPLWGKNRAKIWKGSGSKFFNPFFLMTHFGHLVILKFGFDKWLKIAQLFSVLLVGESKWHLQLEVGIICRGKITLMLIMHFRNAIKKSHRLWQLFFWWGGGAQTLMNI